MHCSPGFLLLLLDMCLYALICAAVGSLCVNAALACFREHAVSAVSMQCWPAGLYSVVQESKHMGSFMALLVSPLQLWGLGHCEWCSRLAPVSVPGKVHGLWLLDLCPSQAGYQTPEFAPAASMAYAALMLVLDRGCQPWGCATISTPLYMSS